MIIIFQTASLKLRKYDFFPISMCFIYNLFAEAFDFPRKYRFSDEKWFRCINSFDWINVSIVAEIVSFVYELD